MQTSANHWRDGSHIHFVNFLWPNYDPAKLWDMLKEPETRVKDSFHIRYVPEEIEEDEGLASIAPNPTA